MAVGVDVSRQNGVGRRAWLQGGLALGAAALAGWPGREVLASHGMAWGGEPRYPESFAHFDYVRPDAPRGGLVRLAGMGTFDSLNPFTLRGIAADGTGTLMFESLAVASWDEPFSVYGLLAEDMILAEDRLSVMFKLRAEARFNDGSPVLAEDVRHSFETLVGPKGHPLFRQYFGDVERLEVMDDRLLRFFFKRTNPELHLILAKDLPVFSRRWGQGKAFDAMPHERPITSGPYVVDSMDLGKRIAFKRVEGYFAHRLEHAQHHGRGVPFPDAQRGGASAGSHFQAQHLVQCRVHGGRDGRFVDDLPFEVPPGGGQPQCAAHRDGHGLGAEAEQHGIWRQGSADGGSKLCRVSRDGLAF